MQTKKSNNLTRPSSLLHVALMVVLLAAVAIPNNAMAGREKYVLDYGDAKLSSHRGQSATLYLKRSLKEQYPWLAIGDLDLRRVVLVAKSRRGHGSAQLQVGNRTTESYRIEGRPGRFYDDRRDSYDRIFFSNPSRDSRGPWQIDLRGNVIVNKVIIEVDDRQRRHRNPPVFGYRF